jgi:presenilin-like A22 family membrane protease
MKHSVKITLIILMLFLLTQIVGLAIVSNYITTQEKTEQITVIEEGKEIQKNVTIQVQAWEDLPYNIERPKVEERTSFIQILVSILLATALALLIIRLKAALIWKLWFFLSVWFALTIAFKPFINQNIALLTSLVIAFLKTFKRNVILHNLSELFIYGGLAAIFAPILNLLSAFIILVIISIYDFIAVRKTKHMIKLAKFQTNLRIFAGLLIPYGKNKRAILGGGDLGFPLLFTSVIFKQLGWLALIISVTTTIALAILLIRSEKGKFYPAMPLLSLGCLAGWLITLLI